NRHIVMQEWNFEKKVPYGSGITGVFAGPPGTGKTMAAQVIANELRMELYKVDLSQLIDKYVGETEKNIKRVFDLAGRSNSVLFFDEADAIFNKRLSADNSNDRFANIESSLLLQCIEDFSGVTLLATNNMGSIDAAFIRRFRFYLQFKEPDEDIRYEIWSSVFPPEAPVRPEVDFRELARIFRFTGAIIKNVAMQAAYLAAERGEGIGMLEIMVAVRRELQKEQRMLSRDLMGKYEYLFPEVINWNSGLKEESEGGV
ncbi:MAG: ATP-binding protein, partial [Lachnospiraceae bacterium]|nr:ATP-binding protein [Lachnospiraceae bacterium]